MLRKRDRLLSRIYVGTLVLLFLIILTTPILIRDGISFITEESLEIMLLTVTSFTGLFTYRKYRILVSELKNQYEDLVLHVGTLNLQTVQVESLFDEIISIPESKHDLKKILRSIAINILSALSITWVLIRIIDSGNNRTLTEHIEVAGEKGDETDVIPNVSNKNISNGTETNKFSIYRSKPEITQVCAGCAFPKSTLNKHQIVVIKAALNSLAILYLVFKK